MRILFITDNFPPELNAPARRTYEHCREWVEAGVDVTVITCWPNFPRGVVFEGYRNRVWGRDDVDGIKVVRVWSFMASNEGFVRRSLDYLSFAFMAFWAGLFRKSDVIVATSPQFFTTFAAFGISLFRRTPWVFELRDIWPESIAAVGAIRKGRLYNILEATEMFLYRRARRILAVTEAFKENLANRGINEAKIDVVPNGVDLDFFREQARNTALLSSLGLENKFVIGYIGTLGMAHGLEFILEAAAKLTDTDCHFLFVGDGAERDKLREIVGDKELGNVTFVNAVARDELRDHISIIDVALVPLRRSDTFKSVLPSKIFENCAMGKPILLGVDGQARQLVEKYSAGLFYEPENEKDFMAKLAQLSADNETYDRCVAGCRQLAAAHDRRRLAQEALNVVTGAAS